MIFSPRDLSVLASVTLLLSQATASSLQAQSEPAPALKKPPFVILKLDDLTGPTPAWKRTVEFLKERNVKSGIGIICKSLEADHKPYFDWVKEVEATGLVEFWHHGWTHAQ